MSAFTSAEIHEMNMVDKYLSEIMKFNQIDWLMNPITLYSAVEPTKNKYNVDIMLTICSNAYSEAKVGNCNKVLEHVKHLYDLQMCSKNFYIMIVDLLMENDLNQVMYAIHELIFTI